MSGTKCSIWDISPVLLFMPILQKIEIEAQRSLVTCPSHIAGEQQSVVQLQAVRCSKGYSFPTTNRIYDFRDRKEAWMISSV